MTQDSASSLELRRSQRFWSGFRAVSVGLVSNLALIVLKAVVGIAGHSQGLVADAIHSAADLVNSTGAAISLLVSRRPADASHPYGHGRAEALGATFASFVIGAAGLITGWDAILDLRSGRHEGPSWLTFWVALLAMLIKLGLWLYSRGIAKRVRSKAVGADARDHLADALASVFVIAGILGARLGYPALDSVGALVVAGFIVYTAYEVFFDAAVELMDTSLDEDQRAKMVATIEQVTGAGCVSGIAARTLADATIIEVHLDMDPDFTVGQAAGIVDEVKRRLMTEEPSITNVIVEMNSAMDEPYGIAVRRTPSVE